MVNFYSKNLNNVKCEKCGQLQYKVSRKYRDFLLNVIGNNPKNKKKFNDLYSLRSKIIHTGQKFKSENLWNDLINEEDQKEFINIYEILLLAKLSIVNWLIFDSKNYRL
jgi:hypothetical protein